MVKRTAEKKVLFVIWGLKPGGAEKVFVAIVNNLNRKFFRPVVVVLGNREGLAEELEDDLEIKFLNKKGRWDVFRLIMRLSSVIRDVRPKGIISFGYYANQLVTAARYISGLKIPLCISERIETASSLKKMNFQVFRRFLLRAAYRKAYKVIAVSDEVKDGLVNHFDVRNDRIAVIYNPVDAEKVKAFSSEGLDHPWFNKKDIQIVIAVGRLVEQKGFPQLINAFLTVSKELPGARLIILGEGEERPKIEEQILGLGLQSKVALPGFKSNPYKYMAGSDLFVLSSQLEGFPNVLIEAMACGTPVISTRCSGAEKIITQEVNGLLVSVGSAESLARAMIKLLRDSGARDKFSKAGKQRVEDFSLPRIVGEYENLLASII